MKKLISILLSILMVLPFVCFAEANSNEPINVALGKSYEAPQAIRGYTASLTDGVVADSFEPGSSDWYGLFWNGEAVDANCHDRYEYITIDLGGYYDLNKIRIHTAIDNLDYSVALPYDVKGLIPVNSSTKESIFSTTEIQYVQGESSLWLEADVKTITRYVMISIPKPDGYHWIMLDEIEIYGKESDYVPDIKDTPPYNEQFGENLVLNKEYVAPEAVRGYTANLTDGVYSNEFEVGTHEWYGLFWNPAAEDQNCPDGIGEITFDLGDYYDLTSINIHYYIDPAISSLEPALVTLTTPNGDFSDLDDVFPYSGAFWSNQSLLGITARYITITICNRNNWVLINEIQIYGKKAEGGTNVAINSSYEAPEAVRGYSANLTDGITVDSFEPATPDWYGLFCNVAASDSNAIVGTESVIIDLGNYYDLTKVALHTASATEYSVSAPLKVEIFACAIPDEGFTSIGTIETDEDYGVFWIKADVTASKARYVRFDITLGNYWAMLDEIEVYGNLCKKGLPYMLGDISGDSEISAKDYSALKRYCFGTYTLTDEQLESADINGDGEIDNKDYIALKRACFDTFVIRDSQSYEFNIVHKEQTFVTDDRLGDLSYVGEGNIAVFGNSFIYTSEICEIFNELSADNGKTTQLLNYSDRYKELFSLEGTLQLHHEGITTVLLCGFYSSNMLDDVFKIYYNCDTVGIELVIFPAHNENRMLLNGVSAKYPYFYVLDWKAEIDMLIENGINRWDMCVDDAHDHSTPLAGYVGAHMIYRAVFGEIPDSTRLSDYIAYSYIKAKLGNYVETGMIE